MLHSQTRASLQDGRNFPLIAAAILLLAFGLRAWNLGDASLWVDEATTAWWANANFNDFIRERVLPRGGNQLPLHIASLRLFPTNNEFLLCFPSVVVSIAAIAAFMLIVRWIYSNNVMAHIAGLLIATNPLHIWLSRAARPYAYFFAAVVFVSFFFLLLVQGKRSRAIWIGFVVSSALAYLTHYFALFLPVAQYLLFGAYLKPLRRLLRPWLLAQIAAGLGLLLLWIAQIVYGNPGGVGIGWIPEPGLLDVPLTVGNLLVGYTGGTSFFHLLGLLSAGIGFALGVWYTLQTRNVASTYWVLLIAAPLISIFVVSLVLHPLYVDRYFSIAQVGALVLMLVGWWRLPLFFGRYALAGLVVLSSMLMVYQTISAGDDEREDWRAAARYIATQVEPADRVILDGAYFELGFLYYFKETAIPRHTVDVVEQLTDIDTGRIWVVYRNPNEDVHRQGIMPDFDPFDPDSSPTGEWLASQQDRVLEREDFNGITVLLLRTP